MRFPDPWLMPFGSIILAVLFGLAPPLNADTNLALVELNKRPFFLGREYFIQRSGRARMILQADRADLGPAFTYLLFDMQNARQSVRKDSAYNFNPTQGCASSALEVELGGFNFTALGHRTETRWILDDGVPVVEAIWWAGGVRVTERIAALAEVGAFRRSIRLDALHLVGEERVRLRLALPPGEVEAAGQVLIQRGKGARLALSISSEATTTLLPEKASVEIGPLALQPNRSVTCESLLLAQIPEGDKAAFVQTAQALRASRLAPAWGVTQQRWATASAIATDDRTVQEIFDKARFGLPGMIADDGAMDAGIFEYGAQWVRDTSNTALGALHAGHFESARAALVRMLTQMISREGATMIADNFDTPDREQFDQTGELMHLLKSYRDWTGDDSLIRQHRGLLLALIERPLSPQFRDDTGMVHNRREFWERTFDDAYELAYQMYVILGLRDAIAVAPALGADDRVARWRTEADRLVQSMLHHPTRALVHDGHLIKRRSVTGEVVDLLATYKGFTADTPGTTETHHRLLPDATQALPVAFRLVDPRSALARRTLDQLEGLWNTRWTDGGYDRYHTSSQPDQPGPWPFATCFILRAQHEAGMFERSRRSLEWLNTCQGGRAGLWFEEIPSIRSLNQSCGLVCWTSGELALFVVRHYLGVHFEGDTLVLRPALYPAGPPVKADLRFRNDRLRLEITGSGLITGARVNGRKVKLDANGSLRLPRDFAGGTITLHCTEKQRR